MTQIIFDKIKNKDDLSNVYNKISFIFDDEKKKNYNRLFKNIKLNELMERLEKLNDDLKKLESFEESLSKI
jgi:uncharacterized protein YydD (DUF2326 family)